MARRTRELARRRRVARPPTRRKGLGTLGAQGQPGTLRSLASPSRALRRRQRLQHRRPSRPALMWRLRRCTSRPAWLRQELSAWGVQQADKLLGPCPAVIVSIFTLGDR